VGTGSSQRPGPAFVWVLHANVSRHTERCVRHVVVTRRLRCGHVVCQTSQRKQPPREQLLSTLDRRCPVIAHEAGLDVSPVFFGIHSVGVAKIWHDHA
jgi:hypothetical protein